MSSFVLNLYFSDNFVMAMASDSNHNLFFSDSFECVLIHFDFIFVRSLLFFCGMGG